MKLHTNGNAVSASEATATWWGELGYSVWVLDVDAEEYVPPAPKRWAVVDAMGDVLLSGAGGFRWGEMPDSRAMTFLDIDGAERLKAALEAGGLSRLRVVGIEEDDAK